MSKEEIIPFGKEWTEGMKVHSKELLIDLLKNAYKELIGLKQIEVNNNGWIKIESEADLPKERSDNDVFLVSFDGKISVGCSKLLEIKEIRSYWVATVTHWQPIQKPLLPIY